MCAQNEYDDIMGILDVTEAELFNIMESQFHNITLDQSHSVVRGDDILNHMFFASNVTDITLADKARVLSYNDVVELFIEAGIVDGVKYS